MGFSEIRSHFKSNGMHYGRIRKHFSVSNLQRVEEKKEAVKSQTILCGNISIKINCAAPVPTNVIQRKSNLEFHFFS